MASASTDKPACMAYRFLGNSGLLVSKLALGSWVMKLAFEHGVNLFDNAETYGDGLAEKNIGFAITKGIAEGVWTRESLVVTTKIQARKHIVEGTKASLKRLELDYVDVIFCHQPHPYTPMEEIVRAMNFVIEQGWAIYWGTSSWAVADIRDVADRLGLIRPIVGQPEYSLLERSKVEVEYADLYKKYKLGLTTWSPLAFGILTGKYSAGAPEGRLAKADKLKPVAKELGVTMAELALAWCVSNENVSSVLVTPEVKAKIDALAPFVPELPKPARSAKLRAQYL
ncbi:hypothetical protein PHYSODRAFT_333485 [Phytophthora sojae]|uniref:NADP-dependent oxidoreductase domain-containing protein n=1 Tax=Phytophthora sojae (strain P6497) TaxID=1094619 RepID=G4ZK96_PHYSP|nr:hypothetical protein PHYSODRAFT_333485 [Phytophthora sojae]EGZ15213.1 hypothetical protein PHYSODRAFT_333485 [Phytophthora sojae]|eukprot:XP_009528962.1 hypothetical protein PHYSODRAFT_333485 [Phytophthora sojae]